MKTGNPQQEKGQAMVVMAFALIVLLGMLALSIDGGRAFTERREAQNAADAATMAAARELGSGASSVTARRIAYETALSNGYDLLEEDISIIDVALDYGTYNPGLTASYEVSITVDSGIEAAFAQFVYDSFLDVNAHSTMEVVLAHTPFAGFGVVSLAGSCPPGGGANGAGVGSSGGGGSGGVSMYGGGMLSNTPPPADCAYYPPGSNGDGIWACTVPFPIGNDPDPDYPNSPYASSEEACLDQPGGQLIDLQAVGGDTNCTGSCDNMGDIDENFNNGVPLSDPLENLPTPMCLGSENSPLPTPSDGMYDPGYYIAGDMGAGVYAPGIYCIKGGSNSNTNDFTTGGHIDATSGVLFYFYDDNDNHAADFALTGSGSMLLNAPGNGTGLNCPTAPEPLDSEAARADPCNYQGLAIFVKQDKTNDLNLGGNGGFQIYGTVYGNRAVFNAHGGGSSIYEMQVHGQVMTYQVSNDGGGSLQVWYEEQYAYIVPPYINALD